MRTTSECEESRTLTSLMLMMISPTWRPEISAGVAGSIAETTTGRDPWMRNPNSPDSLRTKTISSHSSINSTGAISVKHNNINAVVELQSDDGNWETAM